jgi:hypothetical protein
LPFLPLFTVAANVKVAQKLNCSGFTRIGNLTFGVMDGKSGKKRQGKIAAFGARRADVAMVADAADELVGMGAHSGGLRWRVYSDGE